MSSESSSSFFVSGLKSTIKESPRLSFQARMFRRGREGGGWAAASRSVTSAGGGAIRLAQQQHGCDGDRQNDAEQEEGVAIAHEERLVADAATDRHDRRAPGLRRIG